MRDREALELFQRQQSAQRPHGGAAHERRGVIQQPFGLMRQRRLARVADRDQHIAHEAVAADALDGRLAEQRAERRIVEPCKLLQQWSLQFRAGCKARLAARLRELVPRADREAIVAAIDAIAHQRPQVARDRALVLDREIRDAAPRIETVGRRKRGRRADVEAGAADAAVIRARSHPPAARASS